MDLLEHERVFKRDSSRLTGLAEAKIFDEEHLLLVDPLSLNSLEFLYQRSRMARTIVITGADSGIGKTTAALAETHGWQVIRADLHGGDVQVDFL